VTGLSTQPVELTSKRLELLRDIIRLAALVNTHVVGEQEVVAIRTASAKFNIDANVLDIQTAEDIEAAIATLVGQADALYAYSEPLTNANKDKIVTAATAASVSGSSWTRVA